MIIMKYTVPKLVRVFYFPVQIRIAASLCYSAWSYRRQKVAIAEVPAMFKSAMPKSLDEGDFAEVWRRQTMVLLSKAEKPPADPSPYRRICLLETAWKVLERIIFHRVLRHTIGVDSLSSNQFGFRKRKSPLDAILWGIRYCAIVTLDVRNAFNSDSWAAIADALLRLGKLYYSYTILGSYFQNSAVVRHRGGSQGSILNSVLWNVMFDEMLKLKFLVGVAIVGFTDDTTLVVYGESIKAVELPAAHSKDVVDSLVFRRLGGCLLGWIRSRGMAWNPRQSLGLAESTSLNVFLYSVVKALHAGK